MRRYNLSNEIQTVNYHVNKFEKYKNQASVFLKKAKVVFEEYKISISEIKGNAFEFSFFGLDFITKTEISFDEKQKGFKNGEFNTYVKNGTKLLLVKTYSFDAIGNIENEYHVDDFAYFYYIDFVDSLRELSSKGDLKFQLK